MIDQHIFGGSSTNSVPFSDLIKTRIVARYDNFSTKIKETTILYYKDGDKIVRKIKK